MISLCFRSGARRSCGRSVSWLAGGLRLTAVLAVGLLSLVDQAEAQIRIVPPLDTGSFQEYQSPFACQPCHPRQFQENRQSVKSGYRNFSPTFNALELATNFVISPALESGAITTNLRPTNTHHQPIANVVTTNRNATGNNIRAGFCIGCHNGVGIGLGINASADVVRSEIPPWDGRTAPVPGRPGQTFVTGENIRPLRDYHFQDADGNQVLPLRAGGMPPPGAETSPLGYGINCDFCHNVAGPDMDRSFQGDGFGNVATRLLFTSFKVGPFRNAFPPRDDFHQSTNNQSRINYLRSPLLCNGCHDVRVPSPDIVVPESRDHSPNVGHFRLENLSTEWAIGPYNVPAANPFNQVVRCQDCHMSLFPYGGSSTYTVLDPATGEQLPVTSPTPGVFPVNFAAEGVRGLQNGDFGTEGNIPLPRRKVSTHYFTGIDVPLLYDDELKTFLGNDYPSVFQEGVDEYGIPLALKTRRQDLAEAAVRIDLDRSDAEASLGEHFMARVRLIALTGHNLPAGFSQERGVWVQLTVSAKQKGSEEYFDLYRSGYLVDKPHPEVEELAPDGNFHDEDPEHLEAVVSPFTHDNEKFSFGNDDGPHARIFEGLKHGLVFFRNELVRIYGPAELHGRRTNIAGNSRRHPRTGELQTDFVIEEETFSAGFSGFVDNWRALPPLYPRTYGYDIELPSAEELEEFGIELEGPLKIKAAVHFRHFPPLFLRFLARVGGAYVEKNLTGLPRFEAFKGLRGPGDRDLGLWSEERIDDLVRIMENIAVTEIEVPLNGVAPAAKSSWKRPSRRGGK